MTTVQEYNRYGEELETLLRLQSSPIAVKMLESEADIPQGAFRPGKDRGEHYAQCQAFGMSRRDRTTVAMLKEDNWCAYSVTNPILKGEYWINLPDPGEYVRALTQAGEMIFSIPAAKLDGFMEDFKKFDKESMYAHEQMMMKADFPQPDLYKKIFESWGMDHE